jgi:hypothetical protein
MTEGGIYGSDSGKTDRRGNSEKRNPFMAGLGKRRIPL